MYYLVFFFYRKINKSHFENITLMTFYAEKWIGTYEKLGYEFSGRKTKV